MERRRQRRRVVAGLRKGQSKDQKPRRLPYHPHAIRNHVAFPTILTPSELRDAGALNAEAALAFCPEDAASPSPLSSASSSSSSSPSWYYRLQGVVFHTGAGIDKGHYKCAVFEETPPPPPGSNSSGGVGNSTMATTAGAWFLIDDHQISSISEGEVLSSAGGGRGQGGAAGDAYMLAYKRVDALRRF